MDRLLREGNPPVGQLASPVPQYKDIVLNDWAEVMGEGGASYVKDKDALAKLEQVRTLLAGVATETKLEQARELLATISSRDFATQETLEAVLTELANVKSELEAIKANQLTELFGESLSDRPPANSVSVGATFMVVGDTVVYQSNGTDWVVISE